jgi:hypothetical protein
MSKLFLLAGTLLVLSLLLLETSPAQAQDIDEALEGFDRPTQEQPSGKPSIEDALEGFEERPVPGPETGKAEEVEGLRSVFELSGSFSLGGTYNFAHDAPAPGRTDYHGLSRLRPRIDLALDARFSDQFRGKVTGHGFYDLAYAYNGREHYTPEVLETYRDEIELGELWLQATVIPSLDLKIGRQIVVWGKADHIRVVDVLNPLDQREPGMVDIEDLRLPVTMTKLDYYFGPWDLSAIMVHEIRFNKNPAFGSDFFPSDRLLPPEDKPDWDAAAEYGLALQGIFSGWDLSLFHARVYDDAPHPAVAAPPALPFLPSTLKLTHSRLTMYGVSANVASGAWLFKAEAALFDGFEFFNLPGVEKSRLDLLAGVEYSGFKDTTVALELADRHILNYDPRLNALPDNVGEDEFQSVLRITRLFLHDRLEVNFLASTLGLTGENGAVHRLTFKYDFTDHWSAATGLLLYESGTKPAANDLNQNDRVFVEVEYKF